MRFKPVPALSALLALSTTILFAGEPAGVSHPPIPIRFTLPEAGYVTLVIDDAQGKRVRNLVGETPFPAGESTVFWDGLDESLRVNERIHGVYDLAGKLVEPGSYRVRGLYRHAVDLRYQYAAYTPANPPWRSPDGRGGWLGDLTEPSAVAAMPNATPPQMLIASLFSDVAGDNFICADLNGQRLSGHRSQARSFAGARCATRDIGFKTKDNVYYASSGWGDTSVEVRCFNTGQSLVKYDFGTASNAVVGGIAAWQGIVVIGLPAVNELLFLNAAGEDLYGRATVENPRGVAFTPEGKLLVLSGTNLVRYTIPKKEELPALGFLAASSTFRATRKLPAIQLSERETLISGALEDPQQMAVDGEGRLYVSDWGKSQQVKVFSPSGTLERAIGKVGGGEQLGPYDPTRMWQPYGVGVDAEGRLWVAEHRFHPRRISIWAKDGAFVKELHGSSWYGGGGNIDPRDSSRMFITRAGHVGTLELVNDPEKNTDRLTRVLDLPGATPCPFPFSPQLPLDVKGHRYFTSLYKDEPLKGDAIAGIWKQDEKSGRLALVAALGDARQWPILKTEAFRPTWPRFADLTTSTEPALFVWSDLNGDSAPQTNEVSMTRKPAGSGLTIDRALGFATGSGFYLPLKEITPDGVPHYDLDSLQKLCAKTYQLPAAGGQVIRGRDGWTVLTASLDPKYQTGISGVKDGALRWTYPCETFGLHASSMAPMPGPGYLVGITRLLGMTVFPAGTKEELFAINGNLGQIYLFTTDGLFVASLFKDVRQAGPWPNKAARGDVLNDVSLGWECFFPTINQMEKGDIYLVAGHPFSGLFRVEGLESIRRLPDQELNVSSVQLTQAAQYRVTAELARRQDQAVTNALEIPLLATAPTVDGSVAEWPAGGWVDISCVTRGKGVPGLPIYGSDQGQSMRIAAAVAGDKLYVAVQGNQPGLLLNSGGNWQTLFHSGGAVDIQVGTDPKADPNRAKPVPGDVRLVAALVGKDGQVQPAAVLYRACVPDSPDKVNFTSWHTVTIDSVQDVSAKVQIAARGNNLEMAIPLETLGLKPAPGQKLRGDLGVILGNGVQAVQRLYWRNKTAVMVSDIPTEAEINPLLWGTLEFKTK